MRPALPSKVVSLLGLEVWSQRKSCSKKLETPRYGFSGRSGSSFSSYGAAKVGILRYIRIQTTLGAGGFRVKFVYTPF